MNSSALILFSGGQDSTTCLYWAKTKFSKIIALGFNYGQRHQIELEQAKIIAKNASVPFEIIDIRGSLSGSSLTEVSRDMNSTHHRNESLPSTFLPGRNAVFLTLASSFAFERKITDLVTGVCQTDYSGYPDCRSNFITSMEQTLTLALDAKIKIHTPLMNLSKAETWKLAKDLGILEIIRDQTHTDYYGDRETKNEWGYGKLDNPASVLRAKGYEEAKAKGWL